MLYAFYLVYAVDNHLIHTHPRLATMSGHGINGEVILDSVSPLVQCSEASASWTGGLPPYAVQVHPVLSDGTRIVARTNDTRASWLCDYPAGTNVAITVWDRRNESIYYGYKADNIVGDGPNSCALADARGTTDSSSVGPTSDLGSVGPLPSSDRSTGSETPSTASGSSSTTDSSPASHQTASPSGSAAPPSSETSSSASSPATPSVSDSAGAAQDTEGSSAPAGAIAGGVVGGVLGLLLLAALVWWLLRRRRARARAEALLQEPFEIEDEYVRDHVTPFQQPSPPPAASIESKSALDSLGMATGPSVAAHTAPHAEDAGPADQLPPAYGNWKQA